MSKAAIVKDWYQTIWVQGQFDRIERLYEPAKPQDCLLSSAVADPADIREMITILRTLLSDIKVEVLHLVEDGDWVSAILEMTSVSTTTHAPVVVRWQTTLKIQNDRIVENYPSFDFVPFFEQLGQLPQDAFELLLTGAVLDVAT